MIVAGSDERLLIFFYCREVIFFVEDSFNIDTSVKMKRINRFPTLAARGSWISLTFYRDPQESFR